MKTQKNRARMSRRGRSNERGVSMLSALLALVIGAVVVAIGYDQYTDAQRKARIDAQVSEVTSIIVESQKVYGVSNQYGSVTTAVAVRGGIIPPRLRVGTTTTARNKNGGAITLAPATGTSTNDMLKLTYSAVRQSDCQAVIMAVEPYTRQIQIGTTDVKPLDSALVAGTMATQCDAAAPVAVSFFFGRT